ncbi:MAG: Bug family tripartite tricarboxylate transporter substrate binding protein [Hydrogenophaga sp.]|jgi:tripartite-type tricarboxylate transporter receptor subunit TctC|uniref:Bug family tripartite tricarboxylate transporter substrate binding protein n=1 Tax=Hydrogenophaga sp. TaxID=1904254 RepID=UPI00403509E5
MAHERSSLVLAASLLLAFSAHAQGPAWPTAKPVTLIVPFTAGGSVDFIARQVATKLGERLNQTVVIENVAGAGGAIGLQKAVNAAPDGYTLVAGPDSAIAIGKLANPAAYRFDPLKDLVPVGMLNTAPMLLVARTDLPIKNYADFVKLAKAEPGKYTYATSGVGTVLHLAMEQLKQRSGIFVTHVPYRGGAQIANDVMGKQVDLAMLVSASSIPHVRAGSLKALGVTGKQRIASLPDVPTFDEMPGLKGYDVLTWTGIFAPKGTPGAIVSKLNDALNDALKDPDVRARLAEQGALPGSGSPEALGSFAQAEFARNQKLVPTLNLKD